MSQFPLQPHQPSGLIPEQNYVIEGVAPEHALVPYELSSSSQILPREAADFNLLAKGRLPFIITAPGREPKPELIASLYTLLHNLNIAQAWDDLLIQLGALPGLGGTRADLYVVDQHGERYKVIDIELDFGGETGQLVLRHIGRRSRQGVMRVDIEQAYGYMLPVVMYRGKGPARRMNPSFFKEEEADPEPVARDYQGSRMTYEQALKVVELFDKLNRKVYSLAFIADMADMARQSFNRAYWSKDEQKIAQLGPELQVLEHVHSLAKQGQTRPGEAILTFLQEHEAWSDRQREAEIEEPEKVTTVETFVAPQTPESAPELDLSFLPSDVLADIDPISSDPAIARLQRRIRSSIQELREAMEDKEPPFIIKQIERDIAKAHESLSRLIG